MAAGEAATTNPEPDDVTTENAAAAVSSGDQTAAAVEREPEETIERLQDKVAALQEELSSVQRKNSTLKVGNREMLKEIEQLKEEKRGAASEEVKQVYVMVSKHYCTQKISVCQSTSIWLKKKKDDFGSTESGEGEPPVQRVERRARHVEGQICQVCWSLADQQR